MESASAPSNVNNNSKSLWKNIGIFFLKLSFFIFLSIFKSLFIL
jgi:hypothetical protein